MTYRYVIVERFYKYEIWDRQENHLSALITEKHDAFRHCASLNGFLDIKNLKYDSFCLRK